MTRKLTFLLLSSAIAVAHTGLTHTGLAHAAPANLCRELTAYLDQLKPAAAQGPAGPQAAAPSSGQQGGATAVEQGGAQSSGAKPQPGGQDPTQKASGMTGPVPESGGSAAGPQGRAQEAARSAEPAPKAAEPPPAAAAQPKAPDPSPQVMAQARKAAEGNDLAGCRDAAQQMRRAGVALPTPLLTLAAMDLKLLMQAQ